MLTNTGCVQEDSGTLPKDESVVFNIGPTLEHHFRVEAFKTDSSHPLALQHCYRLIITLADGLPRDLKPWLGQPARLSWCSDGLTQHWHGSICRISTGPTVGERLTWQITLASPFWTLQNSGPRNRVFVAQRIPQIVQTLAREHLPSRCTMLDFTAPGPAFALVRQHQETHFSFMHRILSTACISFALIGNASDMQLMLMDAAAQHLHNHSIVRLTGLTPHQAPQHPHHATALRWTDEPLALAPEALNGIRHINPWHHAATNKEAHSGLRLRFHTECRQLQPGACFELAEHPSFRGHYRVISLHICYSKDQSGFQCDVEALATHTPFLPIMPDTERLARTPGMLVDETGQYRYHHPYADSLNGDWYR